MNTSPSAEVRTTPSKPVRSATTCQGMSWIMIVSQDSWPSICSVVRSLLTSSTGVAMSLSLSVSLCLSTVYHGQGTVSKPIGLLMADGAALHVRAQLLGPVGGPARAVGGGLAAGDAQQVRAVAGDDLVPPPVPAVPVEPPHPRPVDDQRASCLGVPGRGSSLLGDLVHAISTTRDDHRRGEVADRRRGHRVGAGPVAGAVEHARADDRQ